MAKPTKSPKEVATLRHGEASRKNISTAEHQSVLDKDGADPLRVAYERRNRNLDPQLVWRGKDEQDWSDLVVSAPPAKPATAASTSSSPANFQDAELELGEPGGSVP